MRVLWSEVHDGELQLTILWKGVQSTTILWSDVQSTTNVRLTILLLSRFPEESGKPTRPRCIAGLIAYEGSPRCASKWHRNRPPRSPFDRNDASSRWTGVLVCNNDVRVCIMVWFATGVSAFTHNDRRASQLHAHSEEDIVCYDRRSRSGQR